MRLQRAGPPLKLDSPDAARGFFGGCFAECDLSRETIWVAHLDGARRCLHLSRHSGDAAGADLPLRTIILDAVRHGSAGLLLAHNHPSGDARPSQADCRATGQLAMVADALGCTVIDHFVFAGTESASFRELGLI